MNAFCIPPQNTTLRDVILWATELFKNSDLYFGHGTNNALDEAAYLVSYCAGKPADFTDNDLLHVLTDRQRKKVAEALYQRIKNRTPAAYITGTAYFAGLAFDVNESVLIPRSPIAELIAEQFFPWFDYTRWLSNNKNTALHILDMCTGSGCIAIACAVTFEEANIDAVDISEQALKVAGCNVDKHHLSERVKLIQSDMFKGLIKKKYDIIVSNPPYVTRNEINSLPDEYHKEPDIGLYAASNGLQFAITLLQQASHYLADNGIVVIEVGNSAQALQDLFPDIPFTWLEFEMGGEGVFMLDAAQIRQYYAHFQNIILK